MTWDPLGTIGNARWIGGGQWAGKTTVAGILARRHGLTVYRHDYQASRSHLDRAAEVLAAFADRFEWALDDLRALQSPVRRGIPVIEVDGSRDANCVADLVAGPLGAA